jgi:hypothetical protein
MLDEVERIAIWLSAPRRSDVLEANPNMKFVFADLA